MLVIFSYLFRICPESIWGFKFDYYLLDFSLLGSHVLLVATLQTGLETHKVASSITDFIDAMGYLGAGLTCVGTGYLVEKFGWDAGFYFWITGAIFAAIMILFVLNFENKRIQKNKLI